MKNLKYQFVFFLLGVIFISSCSDPRRPRLPSQVCQSASTCGDLSKESKTLKCDYRLSNKFFTLKNNHPSKTVEFLVEKWTQEKDQGWPVGDPSFVESKLFRLKGKASEELGCEFAYSLPQNDDAWLANEYRVVQKCFLQDDNCPVISNPVTPNPDPIVCGINCPDGNNPFCLSADICGHSQAYWVGDELRSIYSALEKANPNDDIINIENLAPRLFGTDCNRSVIRIDRREFQMDGSSCDISMPINNPKYDGLWLRFPSVVRGDFGNRSGDVSVSFNSTSHEYKTPMFYMTGVDSIGNRFEKEELITKLEFYRNRLIATGKNGYCFNLRFCGEIGE